MDLVPYIVTLLLGLFYKVEAGMIAGTLLHVAMLVVRSSKPRVAVREGSVDGCTPYLLLIPDRGLFFPSVEEIR